MGYLDNNGLLYLWNKIKSTFVAQVEGKGLSTNDYTTDEKNKLSGIATGATKNTVENVLTSTSTTNALSAAQGKALKALIDAKANGDMLKSVYDKSNSGVVDNAEKVNGHTVEADVPSDAKFTDTTYSVFSTSANGLVPKPSTTDIQQVLNGDGIWRKLNIIFKQSEAKLYLQLKTLDDSPITTDIIATTLPNANSSASGLMSSTLYSKLNSLPSKSTLESTYITKSDVENTYAKKTDLTSLYKYKGSVADESDLPTTGQTVGDVYDIQAASQYGGAGMNVAWNGTAWDALGEMFTINGITNAEIDTICV